MSKILILSGTPTHPTNAGNRASLRSWVEAYGAVGLEVHFAFIRQEAGDEAAMVRAWGKERCHFLDYETPPRRFTVLQRVPMKVAWYLKRPLRPPFKIDDWCGDALVEKVRALAGRIRPVCVHVEYVYFSRLFECFDPSVFKILNTHDKMADRNRIFLKLGRKPQWFYTTTKQEAIAVNRADLIVAIQEHEAVYFKKLTRKTVVVVGTKIRLNPSLHLSTTVPTVIFIASLNAINQDALEFLTAEIWPRLRAALPDAVLEIYGRICEGPVPSIPGMRLMGEVETVATAYERAWLVLSPLRFGSGLKRKCVEALGYGRALVSTTTGAEGLEDGLGTAFLRGDSAEDFARLCVHVLTDATFRQRLEQGACAYATAWNLKQDVIQRKVMEQAGLL